jgi:hypothetical protein
MSMITGDILHKKAQFAIKQAMKTQTGSRDIALLFL